MESKLKHMKYLLRFTKPILSWKAILKTACTRALDAHYHKLCVGTCKPATIDINVAVWEHTRWGKERMTDFSYVSINRDLFPNGEEVLETLQNGFS